MNLIDTRVEFLDGDESNPLVIKKTQEITPDFLSRLNDSRIESQNRRFGEMERVASIPTIVVEKWLREGFDLWKEPLSAIVAKLKKENLEAFLTTSRRVA